MIGLRLCRLQHIELVRAGLFVPAIQDQHVVVGLKPGVTIKKNAVRFSARNAVRAKTKEFIMTATAKKPAFNDYIVKDISLA